MEFTEIIGGIVAGGGLQYFINLKINRRRAKLDYAQSAILFMEGMEIKYLKRIETLEDDVQKLFSLKCENIECCNRKPSKR